MRIGIVTNSYPPNLNGVSKAVFNLSQALEKAGCEVFIATPKVPGTVYASNILPVLSAPAPGHTSKDLRVPLNFGNGLYNFFADNQVDILHSQDTIMGGLDTVFLANKLDIPCVHTYHTMVEDYDYFKFPGYKQFIRSYSQIVCDGHNAVIGLSKKVTDYLSDIGVTTKIYQLPNIFLPPSTLSKPHRDAAKFIASNQLHRTKNIITFGRVAREKNLVNAIRELQPFFTQDPDLRYIIAGDGPDTDYLKALVDEDGLQEKVLFYGVYNYTDLTILAEVCKLFFVTSYSEVQPTTPLEAMSLGLPVVAVRDSAYEYLLRDGDNGIYCNNDGIGAALIDLLGNPDLLGKMKLGCLDTYNNYVSHDWTQDYIKTYLEIIDNYQKTPLIKTFLLKNVDKIGFMNGITALSDSTRK